MPNIFDYIKWRGDLDFKDVEFNEIDNLILSRIAYFPFDNYLKYMHNQIRELLTNYGHLDIMWFDFSYEDMVCEKWKASELIKMVREIQPHIIIDNRLEGSAENSGSIRTSNPTEYSGDFASPEQMIPPKGLLDESGNSIPWESCITLNNHLLKWLYVLL